MLLCRRRCYGCRLKDVEIVTESFKNGNNIIFECVIIQGNFQRSKLIYHWLNSKETHITLIACIKHVTNEEQYFTNERKKIWQEKNCGKKEFQIQTIHATWQRLEMATKICKINDGTIAIAGNLLKNITTIHYGICFDLSYRDANISFCSRIQCVRCSHEFFFIRTQAPSKRQRMGEFMCPVATNMCEKKRKQ